VLQNLQTYNIAVHYRTDTTVSTHQRSK